MTCEGEGAVREKQDCCRKKLHSGFSDSAQRPTIIDIRYYNIFVLSDSRKGAGVVYSSSFSLRW
jgi:hypothetical protein